MPTTTITLESINDFMSNEWEKASNTHGDVHNVPSDERWTLGEMERAMHVLHVWNREGASGNPVRMLRAYGVGESLIIELIARWCDMEVTEENLDVKTEKRADKYNSFIEWTKDKIGEQYTTDALVEVAGFSYITVLKFLSESLHFRKVKKGLWEIRDPKAEREAESKK